MLFVKLRGLNKRGKNRVREHGPEFILRKNGEFDNVPALFVESKNDSWFGWLDINEVEVLETRVC